MPPETDSHYIPEQLITPGTDSHRLSWTPIYSGWVIIRRPGSRGAMLREAAISERKLSIGTIATIVLIVMVAAWLRFWHLDRESLWYDELIMARVTAGSAQTMWSEVIAGRPPLYLLVAWVWSQVWGDSEWALRSLSAVLGLLAVPLTFLLGRRLFNNHVGLIGATLMATSAFQIFYSQEHRYYALYMVTSLASLCFLARALQQARWRDFAGFALFSVLSYYAQVFAVFMIAASMGAVVLLWRSLPPRAIGRYIASGVMIGLGISPSLLREVLWLADTTGSVTWHAPPPLWAPVKTTLHLLFLAQRHTPLIGLVAAAGVGVCAWVWWMARRGARRWVRDLLQLPSQTVGFIARQREAVILLACWWLLPMLAMVLVSQIKPMYVDRYLITTAPAVYLLIGAALIAARRVMPPPAALAVLLVAMSGPIWALHTQTLKDQWREAAAYLASEARPDDVLAFTSYRDDPNETAHVIGNFRWYFPHAQREVKVTLRQPPHELAQQLQASVGGAGRVWLVVIVWADEDMPQDLTSQLTAVVPDGCVQRVQDFYRAKLVLMQFPGSSTLPTAGGSPAEAANAR